MNCFLNVIIARRAAKFFASLIFGAGAAVVLCAADFTTPGLRCDTERAQFCADESDRLASVRCLLAHADTASLDCKQDLQRAAESLRQLGGRGGGLGTFRGVPPAITLIPPDKTTFVYNGTYAGETASAMENRGYITAPLYSDERNTFSMTATGGSLHFGDDVVLDGSRLHVPADFYRAELGAQFSRKVADQERWGTRVSFAYATDQPFTGTKDLIYTVSGSYIFPVSDDRSWILTLSFSNKHPGPDYLPIPGFIYVVRRPALTGMFGLPFSLLQWTPIDPWLFSFSFLASNFLTEVVYGHIDATQYILAMSWTQQYYLRADRAREESKLFYGETRAFAAVRTPLMKSLNAEFQGGQSFGRSITEGKYLLNKDGGRAELPASWFVSLNLRYSL